MKRSTAFNKIMAGLEDALTFVKGDTSKAKVIKICKDCKKPIKDNYVSAHFDCSDE